jgi:hypothetical protein
VSTSVFFVRDFSNFVSGSATFISQSCISDFTYSTSSFTVSQMWENSLRKSAKQTISTPVIHSSGLSFNPTCAVEQLQFRRLRGR